MDPSITIDLTSIAGIVTFTMLIVHYLKAPLSKVAFLQELPVSVYVVLVAGGLTWFAHDVLGTLEGELPALLGSAVMAGMAASGALEWRRAGNRPVADTKAARAARGRGIYLLPILLALGLTSSACASTGKILVETDRGLHATIAGADDAINAVCDAKLRSAADCKAFNASIAAAWGAYENFNKAAQEGSIAAVPAMVDAIQELRAAVLSAKPQASAILEDLTKLYNALAGLLPKEKDDAEG